MLFFQKQHVHNKLIDSFLLKKSRDSSGYTCFSTLSLFACTFLSLRIYKQWVVQVVVLLPAGNQMVVKAMEAVVQVVAIV